MSPSLIILYFGDFSNSSSPLGLCAYTAIPWLCNACCGVEFITCIVATISEDALVQCKADGSNNCNTLVA